MHIATSGLNAYSFSFDTDTQFDTNASYLTFLVHSFWSVIGTVNSKCGNPSSQVSLYMPKKWRIQPSNCIENGIPQQPMLSSLVMIEFHHEGSGLPSKVLRKFSRIYFIWVTYYLRTPSTSYGSMLYNLGIILAQSSLTPAIYTFEMPHTPATYRWYLKNFLKVFMITEAEITLWAFVVVEKSQMNFWTTPFKVYF